MDIKETPIKGLYVIKYKKFEDLRGQLIKPYTFQPFAERKEMNLNFKEVWFTRSKLNVIRGMHFQSGEKACQKLVSCIKGKVFDVILDVRRDSETYGQSFAIEISEDDPTALYIPIDCAHGYKVMTDDSIVLYMATEVHSAKDDIGIHWNSFGFDWGTCCPILSEKDKNLPRFNG
ncbi:MAG: dTDP-4-dehydrorhamnose 3,5-epimerase family protein [Bacillaceae bacterium]|nr:dTDP-4-dehydrorhamnose 3,5-epimerase family protein [Bacillaceae bacterium]